MMRPALFLLSLLICASIYAPAQAQPTQENPLALQGIWSSPDCAQADSLWIVSKYFFIRSRAGGHNVDAARHWASASDDGEMFYGMQSAHGGAVLLNRTNDGLIKVVDGAFPEKQTLSQSWAATQDQPYNEYSHCAKLFDSNPSIGQVEVNTVFLMDMAADECKNIRAGEFAAAKACHQSLYSVLDSDQSGALDRAELMQLYRQVRFLRDGIAACPKASVTPEAPLKAAAQTSAPTLDSAAFADRVLRANGHKKIRFNDIPALMRTERDQPHWAGFLNDLRSLHALLDFIPSPSLPDRAECGEENGASHVKGSAENTVEIQWRNPRAVVPE